MAHHGPNAKRIVACVNALTGIPNPSAIPDVIAALRRLLKYDTDKERPHVNRDRAIAALAKLEETED